MSGIAALIRFDGGVIEPGRIEAMTEAMAHRGPNGIDCWSRGGVALGYCMLQTTPESLEETQPLANEDDGIVLVMDGRLDNWEELRAEFAACGALLRDRSDAELALRAYERWGRGCVDHMHGDFALVIWDAGRREAFCARDRMGHKPLHYHWNGRCLSVASELHAILALPWIESVLNEGLIAERLADDLYSLDETLWQGILRLAPARRMTVNSGGPRIEEYWAPDLGSELRYKREDEYVEHYRALLQDVVRRQTRAVGPLACEVSGGLDSSAVFGVAQRLWREGQLLAPGIDAYTLRFETGPAGRDLPFARAVGAHFDSPVHEITPAHRPLAWYREWACRYRDLPARPNGTMQLGIYEVAAECGSRVILGGDGGDQWLTGDHTYFAGSIAAGRWSEFLESLRRDVRTYGLRKSLFLAARYGAIPLLPPTARAHARRLHARIRGKDAGRPGLLTDRLAKALAEQKRRRTPPDLDRQSPVHRERLRCLRSAHNIYALEAMDRLAATRGIELRSPLNSAAIVQFGFSVPQNWLLRGGWNRYIHRKALVGLLPDIAVRRRGKAEFSVTIDQLRADLTETVMQAAASATDAWVAPDRVACLCANTAQARPADLIRLWNIFSCDAMREASDLKLVRGLRNAGFDDRG